MRIFRFIPAPFATAFLGGGFIRESIQRKQADKYAAQIVRKYNPEESPRPLHKEVTEEEAREILLNGSVEELLNIHRKQP